MAIVKHEVLVNLATTLCALIYLTGERLQCILPVGCACKECRKVGFATVVVTCCCVKTEAVGELQILEDIPIQLELAIESLLLILVLIVVKNVVWVGHTVRSIIITRSVKRIAEVFHLRNADVTRSLHNTVIHRTSLLSSRNEAVLLVGIVHRCTKSHILDFV